MQLPISANCALIILISLHYANCENILVYIGASSHSHRVAVQPLANALVEKGHNVTVVAPTYPGVPISNITEFCPKGLQDYNDEMNKKYSGDPVVARIQDRNFDPFVQKLGQSMWDMVYEATEATAHSPDFQSWIDSTKYDLIITEHPSKEFTLGIAHYHGSKVIAFSPAPLWPSESDMLGIPTESSWYSSWTLGSPYSFIPDKFYHEFYAVTWYLYYKWFYLSKVDSLLKETFGSEIPPVADLIKDIKLYLINTHFSSEYAKSLPPFVVPVGGMHIQDSKSAKPLPKNIQDFINAEGNDGFVFISFGSIAKISALPKETRKSIFDAIASFKNAKFLIKWNDEIPDDMPKNALPLQWFPQQDLLTHPKCRGFVSQGGLMSFQQATYHGVPVVIIPVFGDQPYNARTAVHQGNGVYLELADLTVDSFSDAISQLLYNETLSEKAKEVGSRFKDRPMSPLDTAVWWTEYVLRHDDTLHLKPLGINQEWWQRRNLDFYAIAFVLLILTRLLVFWLIVRLFRFCKKLYQNRYAKDKTKSE